MGGGTIGERGSYQEPEFPKRMFENFNQEVEVREFESLTEFIYTTHEVGNDSHLGYLGSLFIPDLCFPQHGEIYNVFESFLSRFSNQQKKELVRYWIKFRVLLVGYQLFKKDYEQFKQVLKTAKDEEEFCILAGVS